MSGQYVALGRIKQPKSTVLAAARHNLREIQHELGADSHIDVARMGMNRTLYGPSCAAGVAALAVSLMENAGVGKLRKDAVLAVEVLISLPADSQIDTDAFFSDSLVWAQEFFDALMLSAVVHMDESAPHMHILFLPVANGRMVGSDLIGDRNRLASLQADFNAKVGGRYGLRRASPPRRIGAALRGKVATDLLDLMITDPLGMRESHRRAALLRALDGQLESLVDAFGVDLPRPKDGRSFAEIITKPQSHAYP